MKKPSVEFLATAVERTSARAIACLLDVKVLPPAAALAIRCLPIILLSDRKLAAQKVAVSDTVYRANIIQSVVT